MTKRNRKGHKSSERFETVVFALVMVVGFMFGLYAAWQYFSTQLDQYFGVVAAGVVFITTGLVVFFTVHRFIYKLSKESADIKRFRGLHTIEQVRQMDPTEVEHFAKYVFEHHGCTDVVVTPPSNDGGIDHIFTKDGKRIMAQIKRYSAKNEVGRVELQKFVGAYTGIAEEGWFITTGFYNKKALEYAERHAHLTLFDAGQFGKMIEKLPDNSWLERFWIKPLLQKR